MKLIVIVLTYGVALSEVDEAETVGAAKDGVAESDAVLYEPSPFALYASTRAIYALPFATAKSFVVAVASAVPPLVQLVPPFEEY